MGEGDKREEMRRKKGREKTITGSLREVLHVYSTSILILKYCYGSE